MNADNIIEFFKERKHFDGWWGNIEPEIQDEIRQELNSLLRKANEEVLNNGNVVALLLKLIQTGYGFRVIWGQHKWTIEINLQRFTNESLIAALEAARQSQRGLI